jgi:cyanophycinase
MGPVALHGGGEFLPGDERFLDVLLDVSGRARGQVDAAEPLRIVIMPTASARGLAERTAEFGRDAIERRAASRGREIAVDIAMVVDAASAASPQEVRRIAAADVVFLPGGDPDIVPSLLAGSPAGDALSIAHARGAVLAGASAGAMAFAEWSWTPKGGIRGLGFVAGFAVVPHYDDIRRMAWQSALAKVAPTGLGYLGLDERTGVFAEGDRWFVAGEGAAHWFAPGSADAVIAGDGESLPIPITALPERVKRTA